MIAHGIAELTFTMRSPERLVFRAGQFVSIGVPSSGPTAEVAGTVPRRSYSIASQSSAGDVLRFIIRVIPEGKASDYLMEMPLGTTVTMTGPHGFFVLDAVHAGDIVFGATGTGIAAVMPMLGELALRPARDAAARADLLGSPAGDRTSSRATRSSAWRPRRRRAGDPPDRARRRTGREARAASRPRCSIACRTLHSAHVLPGRQRRDDHRAEARAHLAGREPQDADSNRSLL